ncbi:RNA-directed DNA polymerase, eukaryota, reverse transcriptase zinc-binding domain protein [Tanacetum coccineum]
MNWRFNQKDSNYMIHSYRVVCFETLWLYSGGGILFQLKSDSLIHAHAQTTKTYYKHQDSRIMKAQELKTKTSANSDIQDLLLRYQDYQDNNCQGRLLASFQDDAKYEHVGQDTRSVLGDQGKLGKLLVHWVKVWFDLWYSIDSKILHKFIKSSTIVKVSFLLRPCYDECYRMIDLLQRSFLQDDCFSGVDMATSNPNPNGWTWVFGKNNKQHTIDDLFVKYMEKIATSFYVSNFPNYLDAKNHWKEFQHFGRIVDAFIANKRSKQALLRFTKKSYATITHGDISTRETRRNDMKNVKSVHLDECDLIKVEDASTVVGYGCGFNLTLRSHGTFKSNESLKKLWITSQEVSPSFVVDKQMIWIEICGPPLCAWGLSAFKKVTNLFEKFKFFDTKDEDCMSMGRVCIAKKIQSLIHEKVEVNILGKTFQVFVKEIRTWNIHISNDIESNDYDDEAISSNRNVDPIEAFDDFIQHVVEGKEVEKTPPKDPKANDSKPPDLEKDMVADEVVSDNSKPYGFENFIKKNKACSRSSSTSRAGKCSTSFANYSRKDLKGFSFIDEMNRMIEVGGALGYDVKGCKKSLMRLINGIDHIRRVILIGDLNEVRSESERFGFTFYSGDAIIFNSFIHDTGLIDLPMGDDVLHSNTDLKVIDLDRLWSDHFEDMVKDKWAAISDLKQCKPLHTKLKDLKSHLKLWYARTKEVEANRKNCILATLRDLDKNIDDRHTTDVDRTTQINRTQELEDTKKLKSMDLVQKSKVKWEVEGDENSKFFHGLINFRRKSQMVQGIMLDGVWIPNLRTLNQLSLTSKRISLVVTTPRFPSLQYYRPIYLIGIHYKIVAKILANRLSKVIDSIISSEQYSFITRRQILDYPLILSETIDWYKKRKKKMMLFKVDFQKAFNSGFEARGSFSPFLFVIIMEGLHMALFDDLAANLFHGVKVGSPGMHLSHLFYANNVIILSEWNQNAMENIFQILNIVYIVFGLKINIHKSNVYGLGVSSNEVEVMASYTGCEAGFFSFTYLGLPIGSNMSRIANWQPLIDRFKARLSGWKANLLSIGGRLTLIKYVLGSLGNYYLSIFKVPETVVKSLKSLCYSFFWGSSEDSKKLDWVKWSNILASLDKGGLSVGIDIRGCHTNGVWARIVGSIFHLHLSGIVPLNSIRFKDWSRPVNVGSTKAEFDALIYDIANLDPEELVDSDTCIWSLSHDDKFFGEFS